MSSMQSETTEPYNYRALCSDEESGLSVHVVEDEDENEDNITGNKQVDLLRTQSKVISIRHDGASCAYILLNVASSILLVFVNRRIFSDLQLQHMQSSIAAFHLLCTFAVLLLASSRPCRLFAPIRLPIRSVLPLCLLFIGFILLNNLSLTLNSIGIYQMSKHMAIPTIVVLNYTLFRKTISAATSVALLYVGVGVILTDSGDATWNALGSAVAIAAFTTTAAYQVWIAKKLGELQVSSAQLLLNQAPCSCLMLVFLSPVTDRLWSFDAAALDTSTWLWLGLSGVLAAIFNLSQFLVIGRTSALTFNVAGSLKTLVIIVSAWILEGQHIAFQDTAGLLLAVAGALAYSQLSAE